MIKVENLTKRYAGQAAIQDLNFEVGQGEIMGFLGPNGAGKTTTMRILASFMPPTSGRATVAGYDVFEQSLQARAHLGYMPENVPLYNDMRVTEYLDYRAALKGVPHRRLMERVGDVKELCGLKEVEKKLIGTLSKGYRQRVGLADALLHEPDLLILDEPTIGLDPNQIRQVRALIVMPQTTPAIKVQAVADLGGEVVLHGDVFDSAYEHALELAREQDLSFVHPFDDPDVIAGQGTVGMEIVRQTGGALDAIFVPVGGGGLIAGCATAAKAIRPGIRVVGVEPGTPASDGGLAGGDLLLAANESPVATLDDLARVLVLAHPAVLDVDVLREGARRRLSVRPRPRAA